MTFIQAFLTSILTLPMLIFGLVSPQQEPQDFGSLRVLRESQGGTGTSTYVGGDILYADGDDTLGSLPVGTNGQVLKVSGGFPSWGADNTGSGSGSPGAWELYQSNFLTPTNTALGIYVNGTSILSTTTISSLNGTLVVDGTVYEQSRKGIVSASQDCKALSSSCSTVFAPAEVYNFSVASGSVDWPANIRLIGDGYNTVFQHSGTPTSTSYFFKNENTNIGSGNNEFSNFRIEAGQISGFPTNQPAAMWFDGLATSTIHDLFIRNGGIVLKPNTNDIATVNALTDGHNKWNQIYNNTIIDGVDCVQVSQGSHIKVYKNQCRVNADSGYDVLGAWNDVSLEDNYVEFGNTSGGHCFEANHADGTGDLWNDLKIINNTGVNCALDGIRIDGGENNQFVTNTKVIGNTLVGSGRYGILFEQNAEGFVVSNNEISTTTRAGIYILSDVTSGIIRHGEIVENNIKNAGTSGTNPYGIFLSTNTQPGTKIQDLTVKNNNVFDNNVSQTTTHGLFISTSNGSDVISNIKLGDNNFDDISTGIAQSGSGTIDFSVLNVKNQLNNSVLSVDVGNGSNSNSTTTVSGYLVSDNIFNSGTLFVTGSTTIADNLSVNGNFKVDGNATTTGNLTVGGWLQDAEGVQHTSFWSTSSTDFWETQQTARTADDLSDNTTADLSENTNLYYTDARVASYIVSSTTVPNIGGCSSGQNIEWNGSAFVCATDDTGSGGSAAWESKFTNTIAPTNTSAGIFVNASSSINSNLRVSGQFVVSTDSFPVASFERTNSNNASFEFKNTVGTRYFGVNPSGQFAIGPNANLASSPYLYITDTGVVTIGGNLTVLAATSSAYHWIGSGGTANNLDYTGDLYVQDDLEVDGTIFGALTGNVTGDVSGNAGTATALAANGSNCVAGSYALGVDASGAAEGCTDATTEIDSAIATHNSPDVHRPTTSLDYWFTNTAGINTDGLTEGSTNKWYTDAQVASYIVSSTTVPNIGGCSDGSPIKWDNGSGTFICGSDLQGSGAFAWTDIGFAVSTSSSLFVTASSTFDNNLRVNGSTDLATTQITQWLSENGNLGLDLTDNGSDLTLHGNVGGTNSLNIETDGTFFNLVANPGPANGYLMASIAETQGDSTQLNFYEGGTGHNRFWDSGSLRVGGPESYLCSAQTSDVDCNTAATGADLVVQDDIWAGGDILSNGVLYATGSVVTNATTTGFHHFGEGVELNGSYITDFVGDSTISLQGGALRAVDLNCTDCINATEIEDIYLLLSGDSSSGNYTWTGVHDFSAGVVEISNSTNPTVDATGELALDTTDNQLLVGDSSNAARVVQTKVKIWGATIASTTPEFINGGLLPVPVQLDGYTMTEIRCKVDGGTSKVIAVEDASANSTEDITCAATVTSDDGSITNATATAAEEMYIDFGATTGAVNYVSISVFGTWTRE